MYNVVYMYGFVRSSPAPVHGLHIKLYHRYSLLVLRRTYSLATARTLLLVTRHWSLPRGLGSMRGSQYAYGCRCRVHGAVCNVTVIIGRSSPLLFSVGRTIHGIPHRASTSDHVACVLTRHCVLCSIMCGTLSVVTCVAESVLRSPTHAQYALPHARPRALTSVSSNRTYQGADQSRRASRARAFAPTACHATTRKAGATGEMSLLTRRRGCGGPAL